MINDKIMRELQDILGELYVKNGTTDEVVRLSQLIDELIVKKQLIKCKSLIIKNKNN
ncbi:Spo0E family sporulation regulatory protein-aspartic acid phosphatase [Clostridium chrysemydis]|uniref:Spo0E family sporulation regulatory protein-aspartic acid phosphatase n=1 Tax=Clostridium chrysemydis TaxID=2665504 RepID=UPI0018848F36|nr:Spo0E family sporulation regulatory protein-aspartic acid phosphatase [Clostridium chrysemydis]